MRVLLTGATGFLGRGLVPRLRASGHELLVWSRNAERARRTLGDDIRAFQGEPGLAEACAQDPQAVIHLAGERIFPVTWTKAVARRVRSSRVDLTARLVALLAARPTPPAVMLSASAIGIYGDRGDQLMTEQSAPGAGMLATLCRDWEAAAAPIREAGTRLVWLRLGVVLGPGGGALSELVQLFRWGLGGPVGAGSQYLSWIELGDCLSAIERALEPGPAAISGPVNLVAGAVTNRALGRALGGVLGRPSWLKVPGWALKLRFGDGAEAVLDSQRVEPRALLDRGFAFRYTELSEALTASLTESA